jgi:hypothetical protein
MQFSRQIAVAHVWVFRLKDGKAVEVEIFLDLESYEDVIKRVPLPESR